MTSEKQKMMAGELYDPGDPELCEDRKRAQRLMSRYNVTIYGDDTRPALLQQLLGTCPEAVALRAPFYVDYGYNIHLGEGVFFNYGCVCLDVCPIRIGAKTQIGPYVQLLTADHPRDGATRDTGLEFGRPITIGDNVWIGGGALILPGIRIGDAAVIGAGSVVTRDVAPGVTVAGNPARALRAAAEEA
ncbi:sugar O-acetyltransferase [Salipiger bermudensis]|uniref:sugar O-acetyltransferase n=1 Tax=Salipiger bermudensis TaxID=344736 RepID=UPI001C990E1D|nr:sugar O-acetyltransferase [Salipiger bermudensis]MBY6005638.1 sugar O-acetyltransferase [Salipiger bermudensis]